MPTIEAIEDGEKVTYEEELEADLNNVNFGKGSIFQQGKTNETTPTFESLKKLSVVDYRKLNNDVTEEDKSIVLIVGLLGTYGDLNVPADTLAQITMWANMTFPLEVEKISTGLKTILSTEISGRIGGFTIVDPSVTIAEWKMGLGNDFLEKLKSGEYEHLYDGLSGVDEGGEEGRTLGSYTVQGGSPNTRIKQEITEWLKNGTLVFSSMKVYHNLIKLLTKRPEHLNSWLGTKEKSGLSLPPFNESIIGEFKASVQALCANAAFSLTVCSFVVQNHCGPGFVTRTLQTWWKRNIESRLNYSQMMVAGSVLKMMNYSHLDIQEISRRTCGDPTKATWASLRRIVNSGALAPGEPGSRTGQLTNEYLVYSRLYSQDYFSSLGTRSNECFIVLFMEIDYGMNARSEVVGTTGFIGLNLPEDQRSILKEWARLIVNDIKGFNLRSMKYPNEFLAEALGIEQSEIPIQKKKKVVVGPHSSGSGEKENDEKEKKRADDSEFA